MFEFIYSIYFLSIYLFSHLLIYSVSSFILFIFLIKNVFKRLFSNIILYFSNS